MAFASLLPLGQYILSLLLGAVGLTFLIVFHEFGHFLFCKLFRIYTPTFSIGVGPKLFGKKIGETEFKICPIPLGGYVEIGESPEQLTSSRHRSFKDTPYIQKLCVMSGGILFNLLFAYIISIGIFWVGLPASPLSFPDNAIPVIDKVAENSAAQKYGLLAGDTIIAINDIQIQNQVATALNALKPLANQQTSLTISRNGTKQIVHLIPDSIKTALGETTGSLGIAFTQVEMKGLPFAHAVRAGIQSTNRKIMDTCRIFKNIFKKETVSSLVGPIGILSITSQGASSGIKVLLLLLVIISINLAVLNLLPLPILDGGQIVFYSIEALVGRPLSPKIREYIHIATWLLLIVLVIYLSAKDIMRIISPLFPK